MSISATQRNYRCHNRCIRLATTMKAGLYGHFANCIMRLWTAAGECCRRASPGRNLQLHAMPTPNGGCFCGRPFFSNSQISAIEGSHKAFNRSSDAGRKVEYHFCTECGSTVFWYREATPELTAISRWLFYRPDLPTPEGCDLGGAQAKLG